MTHGSTKSEKQGALYAERGLAEPRSGAERIAPWLLRVSKYSPYSPTALFKDLISISEGRNEGNEGDVID